MNKDSENMGNVTEQASDRAFTVVPLRCRRGIKVDRRLWLKFFDNSIRVLDSLDKLHSFASLNQQDRLLLECDAAQLLLSDKCINNFVMSCAVESNEVRERLNCYEDYLVDLREKVHTASEYYIPLFNEELAALLRTVSKAASELVFILGIGYDLLSADNTKLELNEIVLQYCNNSVEAAINLIEKYKIMWYKYRPHFPSLELSDDKLDLLYEALGTLAYDLLDSIDELTMDVAEALIDGSLTAEQLLEGRG